MNDHRGIPGSATARRSRRRIRLRGGRIAAGFTLIELLVVMALMSMLFGIAAAGLSRSSQGTKLDIAWRLVRNTLQAARVSAREQSALARVMIFPGPPARVVLSRGRDAGTWHFDEVQGTKVLAGRNEMSNLKSVDIVKGGTVRNCASFGGGGVVECDSTPYYEAMDGFAMAMDISPDPECRDALLFSFGHAFSCGLSGDGGLTASIETAETGESFTVKTPAGLIAPDRWCRIEMSYDGREILLRVHGVVEGRKAVVSSATQNSGLSLVKPAADQRLNLGSRSYKGLMDEVTYRTIENTDVQDIDADVEIGLKEPVEIRFDADGRLDPRVHDSMIRIPLALEGEQKSISIDLSGVVR